MSIIDLAVDQGLISTEQAEDIKNKVVTSDMKELGYLLQTLGSLPEDKSGIDEAKYLCIKLGLESKEAKELMLKANRRLQKLEDGEREMINIILNGWETIDSRFPETQVDVDQSVLDNDSSNIEESSSSQQLTLFDLHPEETSSEPEESDGQTLWPK